MMRNLSDIAEALYQARSALKPISQITASHPDFTPEQAYAVQEMNTKRRLAGGEKIIGRKIGLTSFAVQKQLGVDEPDFGILFESDLIETGKPVPLSRFMQPKIEVEIAFVMKAGLTGTGLTGTGLTLDDVSAAIDYAVPAFEIVDSAIADWKITLADTVADNASCGAFVLGPDRLPLSEIDLVGCKMALTRNGEEASVGTGEACMGNPLNAVLWLANKMVEVGRPLEAGDVVMSGALGPMALIEAGDQFIADIEGFAPLHIAFE